MFESVSCSKKHLKYALENKSYTQWKPLDDIALENPETAEYKIVLAEKGQEEIDRRKKFLGLD